VEVLNPTLLGPNVVAGVIAVGFAYLNCKLNEVMILFSIKIRNTRLHQCYRLEKESLTHALIALQAGFFIDC
jgi:hypothetical protein